MQASMDQPGTGAALRAMCAIGAGYEMPGTRPLTEKRGNLD